jgi:hypothetical protein
MKTTGLDDEEEVAESPGLRTQPSHSSPVVKRTISKEGEPSSTEELPKTLKKETNFECPKFDESSSSDDDDKTVDMSDHGDEGPPPPPPVKIECSKVKEEDDDLSDGYSTDY